MAVLIAFGAAIVLLGIAMDAVPVQVFLMRNVTSRPLGSLAPGYAATVRGYRVYSGLVRSFGGVVTGVGIAGIFPPGALFAVLGAGFFVFYSVRAIRGEIRTYRELKR